MTLRLESLAVRHNRMFMKDEHVDLNTVDELTAQNLAYQKKNGLGRDEDDEVASVSSTMSHPPYMSPTVANMVERMSTKEYKVKAIDVRDSYYQKEFTKLHYELPPLLWNINVFDVSLLFF